MSIGPMALCGAGNKNVKSQAQALATVSEVQWLMLVRSQEWQEADQGIIALSRFSKQ